MRRRRVRTSVQPVREPIDVNTGSGPTPLEPPTGLMGADGVGESNRLPDRAAGRRPYWAAGSATAYCEPKLTSKP